MAVSVVVYWFLYSHLVLLWCVDLCHGSTVPHLVPYASAMLLNVHLVTLYTLQ